MGFTDERHAADAKSRGYGCSDGVKASTLVNRSPRERGPRRNQSIIGIFITEHSTPAMEVHYYRELSLGCTRANDAHGYLA
jgi:hypothetical protein